MATDKEKVGIYISSDVKQGIDKLCEIRKRSLSNLIEVVLAEELQRAVASGELPSIDSSTQPPESTPLIHLIALIAEGGDLTTAAIAQAALAANVDPVELTLKLEKLKNGNGETSRT